MLSRPSIATLLLAGLLLTFSMQQVAEAGFIAPDQQHAQSFLPSAGPVDSEDSAPLRDAIRELLHGDFRDVALAGGGATMGSHTVQDSPGGAPPGLVSASGLGLAASPSFGSLVPLRVSLPPPFASRWFRPPRNDS